MNESYARLNEKLDTLGFGFPKCEEGYEQWVDALFTPREADLFCAFPNGYQTPADIAAIMDEPVEQIAEELEAMSLRGNLFRLRKGDETLYRTVPVVHGLYEFSVPRIDKEWVMPMLAHLMYGGWGNNVYGTDTPLLRAIPSSEAKVENRDDMMLIDNVDELIKSKRRIALTKCLCRVASEMAGNPTCEHDLYTCLAFDYFADYYIENGFARDISVEEALEIMHRSSREGLVAQVGTSQWGEVMCNCCKCDCAVLACYRTFPGPANHVANNYYAIHDIDACIQCGVCVDRCTTNAITMENDGIAIDFDKCIGCGACTITCPTDSLILRKKEEGFYDPPCESIFDSYSLQQEYRGFPA